MALSEADGLIIAAAITEAGTLVLRWRSRRSQQAATDKLVAELNERLDAQHKDTLAEERRQSAATIGDLRQQLREERKRNGQH